MIKVSKQALLPYAVQPHLMWWITYNHRKVSNPHILHVKSVLFIPTGAQATTDKQRLQWGSQHRLATMQRFMWHLNGDQDQLSNGEYSPQQYPQMNNALWGRWGLKPLHINHQSRTFWKIPAVLMEKGGREAGREKNQPFVKAGEKKKKKASGVSGNSTYFTISITAMKSRGVSQEVLNKNTFFLQSSG